MTEDLDTTRWDMFQLACPDCEYIEGGLTPIKGEHDDPDSNRVACWGCGAVFALQPKRVK